MSEHYDFHYQPTGSGAISGQQVLEQTEDAINELGDYVNDNVGGAMDVAQQALETAQTAETNAQTALDTANSFSSAIQSAQQDASTALSTAQTAQTTASNANNTAIQAQQDASSAVTTANNASGQVSTLSGTVTALGQRVTTAEGNIGQNTSDITALGQRVGTAEGNITTLQNDVSIAQGNASSAMATAGQVKQQAYVFRYSSTALVASSTNSNALLDNTDNLKVGDKVIDSSGVLFSITAIDTQNSTFTIGTALIDLAQDSDVVHNSGNETVGGIKTFTSLIKGYNSDSTQNTVSIDLRSSKVTRGNTQDGNDTFGIGFRDKTNSALMSVSCIKRSVGTTTEYHTVNTLDNLDNIISVSYSFNLNKDGTSSLQPEEDNQTSFGSSSKRWKSVYATNYYYGSNNVEFSTKFVTTDTAQTISGVKSFSDNISTKKIISNVAQLQINARSNADSVAVIAGADATDGGGIWIYGKNNTNKSHVAIQVYDTDNSTFHAARLNMDGSLTPTVANNGLGSQSFKWRTINGLNPSSLGMPDLDNGIDISSYITVVANANKESFYTPTVNGWISVALTRASGAHAVVLKQGNFASSGHNIALENGTTACNAMLPVKGGVQVSINSALADRIVFAYFYPCQGNV